MPYLKKIHELNCFGLEKKLFFYKGKINGSTFSNISNTAVLLGEYGFAHRFIEENKIYLDEKTEDETVAMAEAFLLFYKGDVELAYDLMMVQPKFNSLRYKLTARPLIAQCFFELQNKDPHFDRLLKYQLTAFKKSIKENENISSERKKPYFNFVDILKKLNNYCW